MRPLPSRCPVEKWRNTTPSSGHTGTRIPSSSSCNLPLRWWRFSVLSIHLSWCLPLGCVPPCLRRPPWWGFPPLAHLCSTPYLLLHHFSLNQFPHHPPWCNKIFDSMILYSSCARNNFYIKINVIFPHVWFMFYSKLYYKFIFLNFNTTILFLRLRLVQAKITDPEKGSFEFSMSP